MNELLKKVTLALMLGVLALTHSAYAEEGPSEDDIAKKTEYEEMVAGHGFHAYAFEFFVTSMLWTVIAAALVFIMHLGFAMLEAGLTQQKNAVNIMFKNVFIISIGLLSYALIGFNTHYPTEAGSVGGDWIINGVFSIGLPISDAINKGDTFGYGGVGLCMTGWGDFIFQAMFAATGATIVSGAVAERVKLSSFMIFATILVAIAYPIIGSWHWGGGFLSEMGFKDFAGSAVVHAFGGFAALACVILLDARKGKYDSSGKLVKPIPGHSMPLATIGVFLLMFGWYGFNGGSVLSAEPGALGLVFVTTSLAAAAGAVGAIATSWIMLKKPDLSMALNGILAGLVGITANADIVDPVMGAIPIGIIAGVIVVLSVIAFDKVGIDDPVGAISVHGICGIWGILAAFFFDVTGEVDFMVQIIGIASVGIAAFVFSLVVFGALKAIVGIRVSEEEEAEGLDVAEHGLEAYPDFQVSSKL